MRAIYENQAIIISFFTHKQPVFGDAKPLKKSGFNSKTVRPHGGEQRDQIMQGMYPAS